MSSKQYTRTVQDPPEYREGKAVHGEHLSTSARRKRLAVGSGIGYFLR